MKEKSQKHNKNDDHHRKKKKKKEKKSKKEKKRSRKDSSSNESHNSQDEWVEKKIETKQTHTAALSSRDDWMSMSGMIPTFSQSDLKAERKSKREAKKNIDDYDPSTSVRELNPYWKESGSGLPSECKTFQKPIADDCIKVDNKLKFKRPVDDDDYYDNRKSTTSYSHKPSSNSGYKSWKRTDNEKFNKSSSTSHSHNSITVSKYDERELSRSPQQTIENIIKNHDEKSSNDDHYLSDEKMNKLAAKIVKAEIMGDEALIKTLKEKLSQAREYRKQNPNAGKDKQEAENIMLLTTDSRGNTRPLTKSSMAGDHRSKISKRKADTHGLAGERVKHFANDDKYSLSEMFQQEKYSSGYEQEEQLAKVAARHTNPNDDLEDIFAENISKVQNDAKLDEKNKRRAIEEHVKMEKSLEGCERCIDSKNMLKHLMVSCASRVYVALPARMSLTEGHCIISTVNHAQCSTAIDEDVWEEIQTYRKCLTQMFNSKNEDVIFFETAVRFHKYPHIVIHCVPMPRDVGDTAPIYFKKALLECETEWSINKKVVDLKGKGIRKGIPKGLPYFWVDFGMEPGFAHVIEDEQLFPSNFAEEIIGGILDLDHSLWRRPNKDSGENQRKKVMEFIQIWKKFDLIGKK